MTDQALREALEEAVVSYLLADVDEALGPAYSVERFHREWARRHRQNPIDGCSCAVCFGNWASALEG